MKINKILFAATWLIATGVVFAEEQPYKTDIQITGKESGPYSIGASVKPKRNPYKMDKSKNITNDDLGTLMDALSPKKDPLGLESIKNRALLEGLDVKAGFDAKSTGPSEPTTSSGSHPEQTELIADPVEEIAPTKDATVEAIEDERVRQRDGSIARARQDMENALDRMHSSDPGDRQRALQDYEGAKQRLQNLSDAAP